MKIRSIRASLRLIIIVITALITFVFGAGFFIFTAGNYDSQYHRIIQLEYNLFKTIEEENFVLESAHALPMNPPRNLYGHLAEEAEKLNIKGWEHLIKERYQLFKSIYENINQTKAIRQKVRKLLSDLIESVRYINSHHIANLQNLMRRGKDTQDWDISEAFTRSQVRAAPEIIIIEAATKIQNRLLGVLETFNKLQAGSRPSELINEFSIGIKDFYQSVNIFEDYTLDAQDGLLVEELLENGRNFEENFTIVVRNEIENKKIQNDIDANRIKLFRLLRSDREKLEQVHKNHQRALLVLMGVTFLTLVILIFSLILYGHQIIRSFRRTVDQTLCIQNDLSYPIEIQEGEYQEFQLVLRTLDAMAKTIQAQMHDLEKARENLSQRVKERTKELEETNINLKREIQERITAEDKRIELETRLRRSEKMEAIGLLAGGVAHDLNNILSGVISYPEMLLFKLPEDSPFREPISLILESGQKAAGVVEDLLTLARRGVSVTQVMNLNDVVDTYMKSPEYQVLREDHLAVTVQCDLASELLNVKGSPVHLSKTLMNLVSNAFEAIVGPGKIQIRTSNQYVDFPLPRYDDIIEGDYVILEVSDTGSGMSSEDMKRIFEPFYTKKVMGRSGTGLGMAVVWGTVKDHDGYIDIESHEGKGTSFFLYFPATRISVEDQPKSPELQQLMGQGEHILVIDDIEEQLAIGRELLETLGYKATTACSGEEAVECLKGRSADLLLLDMVMEPGIDGLETYRRILSRNPSQKALIASGYSETERVRKALELGAGGYIKKPYTIYNLGKAVKKALRPEIGEGPRKNTENSLLVKTDVSW